MDKAEIKESLVKNVQEFLTTNDINTLVKKREEILNDFNSSNFKEGKLEVAKLASTLVGNEWAKYIQAVSQNNLTQEIRMEANTSSVLLLTMHDALAV